MIAIQFKGNASHHFVVGFGVLQIFYHVLIFENQSKSFLIQTLRSSLLRCLYFLTGKCGNLAFYIFYFILINSFKTCALKHVLLYDFFSRLQKDSVFRPDISSHVICL